MGCADERRSLNLKDARVSLLTDNFDLTSPIACGMVHSYQSQNMRYKFGDVGSIMFLLGSTGAGPNGIVEET